MSRSWPALELRFTVPPREGAEADLIAAALDDFGATAWQELDRSWLVFFPSLGERDRAAAALPSLAPGLFEIATREVEDEDWARRSQEALEPIRVGRVVVSPPWSPEAGRNPGGQEIRLTILPSMGFGTGHHASTRLCLALLQELNLAGRRLLDIGTGSGVLALAAWALGAAPVAAVDDDPDAVASARDNLTLNGAAAHIDLRCADFRTLPPEFSADVVVANLSGALIVREACRLAEMLSDEGELIVSGVTTEEEETVLSAFAPRLSTTGRLTESGWVGLRFTRTGL